MLVGMEFDSKVHRYLVLDNSKRAAPREAKLKVCNSDNVSLHHYYITDRVQLATGARHHDTPFIFEPQLRFWTILNFLPPVRNII